MPTHPLLLIFNELSTNRSLFDNFSDIDSNAKLDPDLYKLLLVLNRQSDSNSKPGDYKLLSEAEASNIRAILLTDTKSATSQLLKKLFFYTVSTYILALTRKKGSIPIYKITCKLGKSKRIINKP
jgi:hypothetical protein